MNFYERFSDSLPSYFKLLPSEAREQTRSSFEALLTPFEVVESNLEKLFLDLQQQARSDDQSGHIARFLGIQSLSWDDEFAKKILPLYPEYLELKGTRAGLELLISQLLPNRIFTIHEFSIPAKAFVLGEAHLNYSDVRILKNSFECHSIEIYFDHQRSSFDPNHLSALELIFKKELPAGLDAYITFRRHETAPEPTKNFYLSLGERI